MVDYLVEFRPDDGTAAVTITLAPGEGRIIELDFAMNPKRYSEISGDGALELKDGRAVSRRPELGKGSHGILILGDRRTVVRNPKDELKTGTLHAML